MMNFESALKALAEGGVNFVIIGGFAMVVYGSAQVTRDLDICYERSPENLKRLAATLNVYHPRLRGAPEGLSFTLDERMLAQGMNFTLQTDLGDIDLIGDLAGLGGFNNLAGDAVLLVIYGGCYRVASLEALIRSKRAAGRPKDLNSLPELEALKELHDTQTKGKAKK